MNSITKIHYDICDSTNLRAREYLKDNKPELLLITADAQSAGRGRQGKSFFSPQGTGVYMTFAFRADMPFSSAVSVTTAAAAQVCHALEKLSGKQLFIKWVNDIYFNNKKICGILTESVVNTKTNMVEYVIIGVGVNLTTESFPQELCDLAGSLDYSDSQKVIWAITAGLQKIALEPEDRSLMDYYRQKSMVIGKEIVCITKDGSKHATALGIDDDGGLLVRYSDGKSDVLRSGEISLRLANGF